MGPGMTPALKPTVIPCVIKPIMVVVSPVLRRLLWDIVGAARGTLDLDFGTRRFMIKML